MVGDHTEEEIMFNALKSFVRDESGATMIEYGLIAALVSVAAIIALGTMGTNLSNMFNHVSDCLTSAQGGAATC
jgi:pilus assembly protein Flp/PilA